jgi:membrane protein DedA with SNARE-associated domain
MTSSFVAHLVQSYGYYAVFALIALESMGIPLPGETALIAAALYSGTTHHLRIVVLAVVAGSAAVIGDNAGYWIGKTGGQRLAERYGRYVHLDRSKLMVGRYLFARHGVKVVFFGRFVAVLRTYAAFFAGVSMMRWPRFLVANAVGGLLWAWRLRIRRLRPRERRIERRKHDHHRRVCGCWRPDSRHDHAGASVATAS